MASITLRSAVGRPLTNSEVDANFSALNLELGQKLVASLNLLDLPNPAQARSNLGLGNVENKSSATIRGELTSGNVTSALGYTPLSTGGGTLSGQLRAPGMALSGFAVGAAGGNLELGFDGTQTVIQGYNRTSFAYIPIWLESSSLRIGINGSSKVAIDGSALNSLVALQQNGNQVLHAGNYSSYALPLNGGTLSGDLTINHSSASIKAGMWDGANVRVESGGRPLYVVSYGGDISIGRSSGSNFVIGNTGISFGGNQVLHAGNYTNYSPSLNGVGATGTWGINIAGTASAMRSSYVGDVGSVNNANIGFVYNYNSVGAWSGTPIGMSYGSVYTLGGNAGSANVLSLQIAADINHNSASSTKQLWFRTGNNLGFQNDWKELIHSGNYREILHADVASIALAGTFNANEWYPIFNSNNFGNGIYVIFVELDTFWAGSGFYAWCAASVPFAWQPGNTNSGNGFQLPEFFGSGHADNNSKFYMRIRQTSGAVDGKSYIDIMFPSTISGLNSTSGRNVRVAVRRIA